MNKIIEQLSQYENLKTILLSILLLILIQVIKYLSVRSVGKSKNLKSLEKFSYQKKAKNYFNILTIVLLIVLWFSQIHSVLISMFAVAAAIVIATKELIMCFMGGVLININNYFRLGDRIEIDGVRGFVIEKSLTVTKVLEMGPEKNSQQTTGDMIIIPNSVMLSKSVKNESYFKDYSIKSFTLTLPKNIKLKTFEVEVLKWGNEICESYLPDAAKTIESFCKREGLVIPSVKPRLKVFLTENENVEVILKIPVINKSIADIEQKIYRNYITYVETNGESFEP